MDEEREIREYERMFGGHFCEGNGTLAVWRQEAHVRMNPIITFMDSWISDQHYDAKVGECEVLFERLDDKTYECDALQTQLEAAACNHANKVREVRADFAAAWRGAVWEYNTYMEYVREQYEDRVQEVKALSVVQCLLDRTRARNGRPCEESTDEANTEITHCEQVRVTCPGPANEDVDFCGPYATRNLAHWNDYQEGTDIAGVHGDHHSVADCTDITWLSHTCEIIPGCPDLPLIPHHPCTADFINQEYASLPAVPQPAFHDDNSHCNQRPDCQMCFGAVDEAETIDWDAVCTGTGPPPATTTTTTPVPEENCPDPYGNFRVCSAWGDPHFSHVFYRDAHAAQDLHAHGRRGNAFGTMMQHHQVGVYDLARSTDGSFAAQAFFCHSDQARATTSVNAMVVTMNGQRSSFVRSTQTGPMDGDTRNGQVHNNPAVGGHGDAIFGFITSTSGLPSEATDLNVNGEAINWDTLGDGVGGGTWRGRGTHVSNAHHQGREFGETWMQQLSPIDRVERTLAPVCMGDKARTKTVTWSLPYFNRVYEPIISIYMENSTIAETGLCGSEAAQNDPPMETTDARWMFEASEIAQICNVCGMIPDETFGCVNPEGYTPPTNIRQICEFNGVDHDVAQTACDRVAGAAAWLEACIEEYCAEGGLEEEEITRFVQQMEGEQELVSLQEEGSGAFNVLIGNSAENDKCVTVTEPNLLCDISAGHPGVRINLDYVNAPDTFRIRVEGLRVCATRLDSTVGWGMQLEIECQIPAPPGVAYVFVDSSTQNTKCVDTESEVHCDSFSGDLGNRVNDHPAPDEFDITTTPTQVCARRLDSDGGWGMHLHLLCHEGPAPANAPHNVQLLIDRSATDNTRCVTSPVPVVCDADAGDFGKRINDHTALDTFEITVSGLEVCARRTDASAGWGMRLRISCAEIGRASCRERV